MALTDDIQADDGGPFALRRRPARQQIAPERPLDKEAELVQTRLDQPMVEPAATPVESGQPGTENLALRHRQAELFAQQLGQSQDRPPAASYAGAAFYAAPRRRSNARGDAMAGRDPYVAGMALVRLISASVELTAAILMLRYNRIDTALRINGILGLVGPAILLVVTTVGVVGLAGRLNPAKTALIFIGVYLILYGSRP